ncbi:MAG: hypothetical protein F6K11_34660, partial [Leptolyngbya sp. SIO3F4]|nr:hypothetical protein [Leptolyngbya sp. SIO3F4]
MSSYLSSQEIQELAAGYVLGDLNSSEAEEFQALLNQLPELQAEVIALQEALALMPYGLEEIQPEGELRSQILSAAQAELSSPQPIVLQTNRFRPRLPWSMSTVAAALAIVCGVTTLYLGNQVRGLRLQYAQTDLLQQSTVNQTWSGLNQLLQDHHQSMTNPSGPVDFVVRQPDEILSRLRGFQTTMAALPLLPTKQGMLLGGSNCQLGNAQGLRLTYQLPMEKTVSAYQLIVADEEFPEFQSAQLMLLQPDGTGVVLWRDENYLYALV